MLKKGGTYQLAVSAEEMHVDSPLVPREKVVSELKGSNVQTAELSTGTFPVGCTWAIGLFLSEGFQCYSAGNEGRHRKQLACGLTFRRW